MSFLNLYQDIYVACALCRHDVDFHVYLGPNDNYEVMRCIFPTDDVAGPNWPGPDCNCKYYYDCIVEEDEEDMDICRI